MRSTTIKRVVGGAGTGMLLQLKRIIQLPGDEAKLPITQGAGGKWVGAPGTDQDDPGDVAMLTRAGFVGIWERMA